MPPIVLTTKSGGTDPIFGRSKSLSLSNPVSAWMADLDWDDEAKHVRDPYRKAVHVYAACSGVAEAVAAVDVRVQTLDNDPVDDPDDPSVRLLRNPNGLMDRASFVEETLLNLQLDGQVFWIALAPFAFLSDAERAVYVASDSQMEPLIEGGRLFGWKYTVGGKEVPLSLDRVCRIYFVNPGKPLKGLSVVEAAQTSIDQHVFASEFNSAVFQNGASLGNVYSTEHRLDSTQRKQIEDTIRQNHGGHRKARKDLVLWGGLKREPGQTPLKDMEWLKGKEASRDEILTACKVPPVIAGIYDRATLNNSREQVLLFWDHRGKPLAKKLYGCWNGFVQAQIDRRKEVTPIWASVEALKERDVETTDKILGLQKHGVPLNRLIEVYDLPFERTPWGDEPLVSAGLTPISVVFADAADAAAADRAPEGSGVEEESEPAKSASGTNPPRTAIEKALKAVRSAIEADSEKAKDAALHRRIWNSWQPIRRESRTRIRRFIVRQANDVLRRLHDIGPADFPGKKAITDYGLRITKGDRTKSPVSEWLDRILLDLNFEDEKLSLLARFEFKRGAEFGGQQVATEVGATDGFAFNIESPAIRRHLAQQAIRVRKVNRTTQRVIRRALLDGLDAGETVQQMSKRVADAMGVRADRHSYRIANTEIHEAVSAGRHEGMKQIGVKKRRWLTSGRGVEPGGPVRKSHWLAEQMTKAKSVPVGEKFKLINHDQGTESLCDFPGQGVLPPGERIHCSCIEIAVRDE